MPTQLKEASEWLVWINFKCAGMTIIYVIKSN